MNSTTDPSNGLLSIAGTWIERVFDRSTLGILQVNHELKLLYGNDTARDICGFDDWTDKKWDDVVHDPDVRDLIHDQMHLRSKGFSDEYEIEIVQLNTGKKIPVSVAAMPVMASDGGFAGSIAILKNLDSEKAIMRFHQLLDDALGSNADAVLQIAAEQTRLLIPFDSFAASAFSSDGNHVLVLFASPEGWFHSARRWYPITAPMLELAQEINPSRRAYSDILAKVPKDDLRTNEDLTRLIDEGYQSMLRYPVESESQIVGSISISRKGGDFSSAEFETFRRLPLPRALLASLFFRSRRELEFRLELIQNISKCNRDPELFKELVDQISRHYSWSHISVFTVDDLEDCVVLQSQCGKFMLPDGYSESVRSGLLGQVVSTRIDVNIANVRTHPEYKNLLHSAKSRDKITSELCMAIFADDELYALLNVVDDRENAFSAQEQATLRGLLNDIGLIIDQRRKGNMTMAAVMSTPTAVFLVDRKGVIRLANAAAGILLGYSQLELLGTSLAQYVSKPEVGAALLEAHSLGGELEIVTNAKKIIRVQVGGSSLGESAANRRMIIFRDLALATRTEVFESAKQIISDVAKLVNTPLSIVSLGLQELLSQAGSHTEGVSLSAKGVSDKKADFVSVEGMIRQLNRVGLTYNELQLFGMSDSSNWYQETRLSLKTFLNDVIAELPVSDIPRLRLRFGENLPEVHGDTFQLSFVIQTIAVHLLQISGLMHDVEIDVEAEDETVRLTFKGISLQSLEKYASKRTLIEARASAGLLLADEIICQFVLNHRGTYYHELVEAPKIALVITIPALSAPTPEPSV